MWFYQLLSVPDDPHVGPQFKEMLLSHEVYILCINCIQHSKLRVYIAT